MNKKIILAILVLAVFLMTACTQQTPVTNTGYIGGTQGLEIAFLQGAPPSTVSSGGEQDFDIVVEVQNKGEYYVEANEAFVKISGFSPSTFGVTNADLITNLTEDVEPNTKQPDGTIIASPPISVEFTGFNYEQNESVSREFPIRAEICYKYQTEAAAELCVKEEFTSTTKDSICEVNSARAMSTSAAPVQVTNLKQSSAGKDKTRVTFTVSNMDTGKIFKTGNSCDDKTISNQNKVFVEILGLDYNSADSVKCVGLSEGSGSAGYVTLSGGEPREVSCTITLTDRNNRIEPFNIRLTYDYWKFIDTRMTVQHTQD